MMERVPMCGCKEFIIRRESVPMCGVEELLVSSSFFFPTSTRRDVARCALKDMLE